MHTRRTFLSLGLSAVFVLACGLFDRVVGQATGSNDVLLLNEVLFFPAAGADPFVELKTTARSSLEGLSLTNEAGERFSLPAGLPALTTDRYLLIVFDSGNNVVGDVIHADRSGFLNSASGFVELTAADGTVLDRVAWGVDQPASVNLSRGGDIADLEPGTSIARFPLSIDGNNPLEWTIFSAAQVTAGAANPQPGVEVMLPLNGAVIKQLNFELSWYPVPGAVKYQVQVSADESFSAPTIDETVAEAALSVELKPDTYFWRVQAMPESGSAADFSPVQKITVDPAFSSLAHLSAPDRQSDVGVPFFSQHKDTAMLLLESKNETGEHAWDVAHPGLDRSDPADNANCALASIAMINADLGGDLTQDRLGYELYKDVWPGPEYDLNYGHGTTTSQEEQLLTFALDAAPTYRPAPETTDVIWADVQWEIDAGRPIFASKPGHAFVITGYYENSTTRYVMINDPWWGQYAVDLDAMTWGRYFLISPDSVPVFSEPEISMDSDGDGIVDFDESERFGTDPSNDDSDQDKVKDKDDVRASIFDEHFGYAIFGDLIGRDYDDDGVAMEMDEDADGGGCFDGMEDFDLDGKYKEPETWNFDEHDDACFSGTDEIVLDTTAIYDDGSHHQRLRTYATFSLQAKEQGRLEGLARITYSHDGEFTSEECTGTHSIGNQFFQATLEGEFQKLPDGGTHVSFRSTPSHGPPYTIQWITACPIEPEVNEGWSWPGSGGTLKDGVYDYFADMSSSLSGPGEFWQKTHIEQGGAQQP